MDPITFLIEESNLLLTCLLNPEEGNDSLTIKRSSGATREQSGSLTGSDLSVDRIVSRGRGDTRLTLKLLFDVSLAGSSIHSNDVRDLTAPFLELAEYPAQNHQALELPHVRLIWGKGWDIPVRVESVAERCERFSSDGRPQRSWLTLGLLQDPDEHSQGERPALHPATQMPPQERLTILRNSTWGVHEKLGDGVQGETLCQLAGLYYGDPRLWRLIALANDIADPLHIPAGTLLVIPPFKVLKGR